MRSYDQYCPLAMGLDIVGDRWTLLIVRELGVRPGRYRDLHEALPGLATNLLAERLRALTAVGVIEQQRTGGLTVHALTDWGRELYAVVVRLGRWGAPTLFAGPDGRRFRARYAIPVVQALYALDADLAGLEPLRVRIDDADGEHVLVTLDPDGIAASISETEELTDVVLDGRPEVTLGLLAGALEPRDHVGDGFRAGRVATRRFRAWTRRGVRSGRPLASAP